MFKSFVKEKRVISRYNMKHIGSGQTHHISRASITKNKMIISKKSATVSLLSFILTVLCCILDAGDQRSGTAWASHCLEQV